MEDRRIATYLLCHRHAAHECAVSFAAWKGFDSPLRHRAVPGSCLTGGHCIWWTVDAPDAASALAFLPAYVAGRTEPIEVRSVSIP